MKKTIDSYVCVAPVAAPTKKQKEECEAGPTIQPNESQVLNTAASSSSLKPSGKEEERHYNKQWEQKNSWLVYEEEIGSAFCRLCQIFMKNEAKVLQKTGGVFLTVPFKSFKKTLGKNCKLQKHEHSSAHTISAEMENLRRQAIKNPFMVKLFNSVIVKKIKEDIAHITKYGSLIENIFDNMNGEFQTWRKTLSDRSNYSSKETVCALLECIGEVLRDELKEILKTKKFSILADESTSLRNEMELSMMFRVMEENVRSVKLVPPNVNFF
ncbi:hypothetical protein FQA39_LY13223 [Lamprigera yunnana]|nr:hypothetical protein FQA39_LY13223 [Lamprigera yunnana]